MKIELDKAQAVTAWISLIEKPGFVAEVETNARSRDSTANELFASPNDREHCISLECVTRSDNLQF